MRPPTSRRNRVGPSRIAVFGEFYAQVIGDELEFEHTREDHTSVKCPEGKDVSFITRKFKRWLWCDASPGLRNVKLATFYHVIVKQNVSEPCR